MKLELNDTEVRALDNVLDAAKARADTRHGSVADYLNADVAHIAARLDDAREKARSHSTSLYRVVFNTRIQPSYVGAAVVEPDPAYETVRSIHAPSDGAAIRWAQTTAQNNSWKLLGVFDEKWDRVA